jgi:hypothetical protein
MTRASLRDSPSSARVKVLDLRKGTSAGPPCKRTFNRAPSPRIQAATLCNRLPNEHSTGLIEAIGELGAAELTLRGVIVERVIGNPGVVPSHVKLRHAGDVLRRRLGPGASPDEAPGRDADRLLTRPGARTDQPLKITASSA